MKPDIVIAIDDSPWKDIDGLNELVTIAACTAFEKADKPDFLKTTPVEISFLMTSNWEIQSLNKQYRSKDAPTNVLSFPQFDFEKTDDLISFDNDTTLIGDVILAFGIINDEAKEQGKQFNAHLSHLVVHGLLHLLGYDHIDDEQAQNMEQLECDIMTELGHSSPY